MRARSALDLVDLFVAMQGRKPKEKAPGGRSRTWVRARGRTRVARMTPIGTPELILLLVALGGMTAAATWAVIELKKPRRWMGEAIGRCTWQ